MMEIRVEREREKRNRVMKKGRLERKETRLDSESKEDQDRDPWSVLADLYTRKTRFKAESELRIES
jgi:hypothetical protein